MRTIHQIEHDIAYEEAEGIHTYHQCKCKRMATRTGKCALCLKDELRRFHDE